MLILREVLAWRAREVADLLATTPAAVNSALQRARAQLAELTPDSETVTEPEDPRQKQLLDRYARASETVDYDTLARTLAEDALLETPPAPGTPVATPSGGSCKPSTCVPATCGW